ncbi:MAG: 3-oxoadipate enol-lactonase [Rhodobacterales bacterium]|nr:3-oxoadipate enol-lactonase [Rhodobacterales bacterium]
MPLVWLDDIRLNAQVSGPADGPALVLAHALGTDLTLWDAVVPLLPPGLRVLRFDARGHGGSDVPPAPYAMGALIRDAERLIDHFALHEGVVAGVSMGGMVAQGLAIKRPDRIRALVLSNTAVKIATPRVWQDRIAQVRAGGVAAIAPATVDRWFPRPFRDGDTARHWQARLAATPVQGWCGCAAAIAGTDFYTPAAALTLPVLAVAGGHDGSTPADLVAETAALIPGARFHLIRAAGHLPMIDRPADWAAAVTDFLKEIGHV